jgi:hypothetical protein
LAVANFSAEKPTIALTVEQQPGGIMDHLKTAVRVPIAKRLFPISCHSWICEEQIAQNEQENGNPHGTFSR